MSSPAYFYKLTALQDRTWTVGRIIRKLFAARISGTAYLKYAMPQNAISSGTSSGPCSRCAREGNLLV